MHLAFFVDLLQVFALGYEYVSCLRLTSIVLIP